VFFLFEKFEPILYSLSDFSFKCDYILLALKYTFIKFSLFYRILKSLQGSTIIFESLDGFIQLITHLDMM